MKQIYPLYLFLWLAAGFTFLLITGCEQKGDTKFVLLDPAETGVDFKNQLTATPELNIFNYLYFYDGAGVAAGDLNGNGYPDLYFTSNQGKNRLYINHGDFTFEDVTDRAFSDSGKNDFWSTGVTLADVSGNGRLDIYVSNVGNHLHFDGHNQLLVNTGNDENGVPRFEEKAAEYGLDFSGLSTQAVFFDYNLNGRLDMYLMNHSIHEFGTFDYSEIRSEHHPLAGDRLFRNNGEYFEDVTAEAGIYSSMLGYGLGVAIGDITGSGYPDIYIGNDFHEDDYLYINNGDGTFTESLEEMIQHTSYSSMGNDLVDINNNGLLDIFSLDMLPEDYEMRKTAAEEDPLDIYQMKRSYGFKHKFSRNTLQLNRGGGKFSEIGMLAGVHATDWSWAALGADFDNSGFTDIFVSNGIKRRTNDMDYINLITQDKYQQMLEGPLTEEDVKLAGHAPSVKIPNYMFKNNGTLFFGNKAEEWGLHQPTYSSGAIYADLNNDGALDIIINNVNETAFIYRNQTRVQNPGANFLKVRFEGPEGNRFGIGSKITIPREDGSVIIRELYLSRGFQSSVEPVLHAGVDSLEVIPELIVEWPGGRVQVFENIETNQTITARYLDAEENGRYYPKEPPSYNLFEEITEQIGIPYVHEENNFIEFNREALIPHMVSREGPAVAVGDVTGNGLDDIFAGGARHQYGSLFLQQPDGTFQEQSFADIDTDANYEDVDAVFEDFTGNGHIDLLVVSGGNEYSGNSEFMRPRLYVNDGEGNLTRDSGRIPDIYLTGSVAAVTDISGNGMPDLFIGARAVPWSYGQKPKSYLLINLGDGHYEVDESVFGRRFSELGMVTGAEWADMNGDGRPDLVVASEWEGIKIVYNDESTDVETIPNSSGLWNTVSVADLNNNGRPDILAGNLGLNSKLRASESQPLRMYVNDFDGNGTIEQIVTVYDNKGEERLFARFEELSEQLPYIGDRFETHHDFAAASLYEVIDRRLMNEALTYEVTDLRSAVFYQKEDGFHREALPLMVQFAPVYTFLVNDLTGNGCMDVISAGNFFDANIQRGRYSADYGNVLINDADGALNQLPNHQINWFLEGQIRKSIALTIRDEPVLLFAGNDTALKFFRTDPVSDDIHFTQSMYRKLEDVQ